jgi:hypothetical protein
VLPAPDVLTRPLSLDSVAVQLLAPLSVSPVTGRETTSRSNWILGSSAMGGCTSRRPTSVHWAPSDDRPLFDVVDVLWPLSGAEVDRLDERLACGEVPVERGGTDAGFEVWAGSSRP